MYFVHIHKIDNGKEARRLPRGNRTGPLGLGPRTGRGLGYCSGYTTPGFTKNFGYFGRGFGRGFGMRYPYYSPVQFYPSLRTYPLPPTYPATTPYELITQYIAPQAISKEEKIELLEAQKEILGKQLSALSEEIKRIKEE